MEPMVFLERIVLEILNQGDSTDRSIAAEIGIKRNGVDLLLANLKRRNLIKVDQLGNVSLIKSSLEIKNEYVSSANTLASEAREITELMIEKRTQGIDGARVVIEKVGMSKLKPFSMRKVYVKNRDEKFLWAHFRILEKFLDSLPVVPMRGGKVMEKTIFCYGMINYADVVRGSLSN